MSTKTGGYAFPTNQEALAYDCGGMELRDYFAAHALNGLVANSWSKAICARSPENAAKEAAQLSYQMADAMLKERCK